jgi:toxin-antitoxin system PIN domain toxin
MTAFLLDVNVLIALIDRSHIHHNAAHRWFGGLGNQKWATCPITENGVLRIIGGSGYPNSPGSILAVARVLAGMTALPGHVLWPDDISLISSSHVDVTRLLNPGQITDSYLLALASSNGGKLATFDRKLIADAVRNGKKSLHMIG